MSARSKVRTVCCTDHWPRHAEISKTIGCRSGRRKFSGRAPLPVQSWSRAGSEEVYIDGDLLFVVLRNGVVASLRIFAIIPRFAGFFDPVRPRLVRCRPDQRSILVEKCCRLCFQFIRVANDGEVLVDICDHNILDAFENGLDGWRVLVSLSRDAALALQAKRPLNGENVRLISTILHLCRVEENEDARNFIPQWRPDLPVAVTSPEPWHRSVVCSVFVGKPESRWERETARPYETRKTRTWVT